MDDRLYENAGEYTRQCLDELFDDQYSFLDEEDDIADDYLHNYMCQTFADGLTESIQAHGYTGHPDDVSEKVDFVLSKCAKNGVTINRTNIRNWFEDKRPVSGSRSRELVYQLCFGLGFSLDDTVDFFLKVYFECPFNYREPSEAVYYYCFANGLNYSDAQRIIVDADTILDKHTADEPAMEYTHMIGSALKNIHTEQELLSFIDKNSREFFRNNRTAQKYASELIDKCCELAVEMFDLEATKVSGKNVKRKQNIDLLLFQLLGANLLEYTGEQSFAKAAELPETIKSNFPLKMHLSNIRNGKQVSYETMRKTLILLSFYQFYAALFSKNYQHCAEEDDFRDFVYETDDLLITCGYPKLYIRNPFDWLVMHCSYAERPLDEFREAIARYYTDIVSDF